MTSLNTTQHLDRLSFDAGPWTAGMKMACAPGDEIYAQEDEADLIYKVVRGVVRTTYLQQDGRRQVGDFYYAGDVFGVEFGDIHRFSAEALMDCEIQVLKRAGSAAYEPGQIDRLVWSATAQELERTQAHMLLLGRSSAAEKVARFLLELARRFGGDLVALPMTRQDMADYLGLTIETISRMLGRLQSEGLVEFDGARRFRVRKPAALQGLAAA